MSERLTDTELDAMTHPHSMTVFVEQPWTPVAMCATCGLKLHGGYEIETHIELMAHGLRELRAQNAALVAALEELVAHQNGPPLSKYEAGWEQAMKVALALLSVKGAGE